MKLKILAILIILTSLLFLFTGCTSVGAATSWPGFTINGETGFLSNGSQTYAVDIKNGSQLWNYPSDIDRGRSFYAAPTVADGLVVVGDYNGSLTALNETNGTIKWEFNGASDRFIGSALIIDGMIYAPNSDYYLYALDTDGSLMWKFKADGPNWTTPLADENSIYLASMDHHFYAFPKNISVNDLVNAKDGSRTLLENAKWTIDLGMAVTADPVLVDGKVYVATIEGNLFAIDPSSEKVLWNFNDNGNLGAVWGTPVVTENAIFIADMNGNIYAIDPADGSTLWPSPFSVGGKVIGSGSAFENGVIFATDEGKIFSINSDKEPKTITNYEFSIISDVRADGESIVFAPASSDSLFTEIDPNGFEVWSFLPSK